MKIKELLEKNNIVVDKVDEEIKGSDGIIVPVVISNKKYFFKFLPISFQERLEREIGIVEILRGQDIKVPNYYKKNNQVIFQEEDEIFYASEEVPGKKVENNISFSLLEDIMIQVARMHKVLKEIPVAGKKESDIDRLRKFYKKEKRFFEEHHLSTYIESIIDRQYDEEDYSYIHADINFRNIFAQDDKVTSFIDFTDLRVGYLEDDLGKLFQNILYLDLSEQEIQELIKVYEQELGQRINQRNLLVSIIFRIIYRYHSFVINKEGNIEEYKGHTEKILQKLTNRR